jgi:hypothetical protein
MKQVVERGLRRIGRAAEPLLNPGGPGRRLGVVALEKRVEQVGSDLRRFTEQVDRLVERADTTDASQVKQLRDAVWVQQSNLRRRIAFQKRLVHKSQENASGRDATRERALRRIMQVARRGGPVLIGPWTGEVGFELLYWTPFVRWAVDEFRIDPGRITLLSRGGTASWYGIDGANYLDVLEFSSPEEFRLHTVEAKKQRRLRLFDRHLIRQVWRGMEGHASVLHPAMMYALYMPYWKQQTSIQWVQQLARFARIRPPLIPDLQLPRDYVALRFYFSENFPDTPENRAFIKSLIESLAEETHVLLLGTGVSLDEHADFTAGRRERVHTVEHVMRPETNLAVQTAVIAGARSFIGTYGGFSYLAPLCGVRTVAVYSLRSVPSAFGHHLDFARQAIEAIDGGTLTLIDLAARPLLRHLAADAAEGP